MVHSSLMALSDSQSRTASITIVAIALLLLIAVLVVSTFLSWRAEKAEDDKDVPYEELPVYQLGSQHNTPSNTGVTSSPLGGHMPRSVAKYKQRAQVASALQSAGVEASVIDAVLEGYDAKNPSAFTDESTLSDAEFRKKTVEFTRRHLRRFPKTQSALALSLRALAKGETTSYIK